MGFLAPLVGLFGGGGIAGIFGGGLFGQIFGKIISFAFSSLLGGQKKSGPSIADRGLTQMVKQAIVEREIVYGRIKKSGPVVYLSSTGAVNKFAHLVVVLASHECEAIESIFIDDIEVQYNTSTGQVTNEEFIKDGEKLAWVYTRLGASGQTAFQELIDATSGEDDPWTSSHTLSGMCAIYVKLKWNSSVWSNGLPNISAVVKGKNDIYDPRTGLRSYTDNAALCIFDYLSNKWPAETEALRTPIGLGIVGGESDTTAWSTEADICDELVPVAAGGNEKRYTCNGVVNTLDSQDTILEALLTSCAGKITYRGGQYFLLTGTYRTPAVTLTQEDILSDISVAVLQSRADVFNGVKGTYVTEDNDWQASDFPPVKSDVFKAEDSDERIWQDIELNFTTSASTCQRLAKILLFAMRQQINVNLVCTLAKGMQIAVGDVIYMTDDDMGWANKPFEVTSWDLVNDEKKGISTELVLRETAAAIYDWSTDEESTIDPAPNTTLPSVRTITAPTNLAADSGTEQLLVDGSTVISRIGLSWDITTDQFVLAGGEVHIQYRKATDTDWNSSGITIIQGYRNFIHLHPVEDGTTYDIRVRYRNFVGTTSDWSYLYGHVVVGKSAPPSDVINFRGNQNGAFVTLEWDEVEDIDLDSYQLRLGTQGDASWATAKIIAPRIKNTTWSTSVLPPGNHTILIKSKDTTGNFSTKATSISVYVSQTSYTTDTYLDLYEEGWSGTLENMIINYSNNTIVPDSQTISSALLAEEKDDIDFYPESSYTWPTIDLGSDKDIRVWCDLNLKKIADTTTPIQPLLYISARSGTDASGSYALDNYNIINSNGTLTNMVIHNNGKLLPESTVLASNSGIMDEFVKNQNSTTYYTSEEFDLGEDTVINIDVQTSENLGPGETIGEANVTVGLDYRTSAGAYTGTFSEFSGGSFTARYFKIRLTTEGTAGKTIINSAIIDIDDFVPFTGVGEFEGIRYVQIKLVVDTSKGVAYCKDYTITVDTL